MYSRFMALTLINNLVILVCSEILHRHWKLITLFLVGMVTWLSLRISVENAITVPGNDKMHHLMAYAALAFPVAWARPRYCALWLFGILIWSGLIEIVQPWFYREMDALDLLANSIGLILGFTCARGGATLVITNRPSGAY